MRESLKAYYLQQMGIKTWVRRNLPVSAPLLNIIAPYNTQTAVMIVLEGGELDETNQWLSGKVGQLLKKMLYSIGLSSDNTAIICSVPYTTANLEYHQRDALMQAQIVRLKPKLILQLGDFSTQCLQPDNNSTPVILSDHPINLLNNPLKKKQVFSDLMMVKRLLADVDQNSMKKDGATYGLMNPLISGRATPASSGVGSFLKNEGISETYGAFVKPSKGMAEALF